MGKILKTDLFWSAVLLISLFLLSIKFLTLWFIMDDTSCIYASTQNPINLLFDRDTYLFFNKMFYTPLLPISFRLDYMLFGLRPLGYHVHNMLAAFFTGLIGYGVYRLYLPSFESWAGTFLFALSYPVVTNIGWITRKHYLWGSFFILASFYFFKKSDGKRGLAMPLISYLFYLTALLFKEAFAPFPAIVFLLAEGRFRERALKSLPYFLLLCLYLALRFYIIGGLGGYIGASPGSDAVSLLKNYIVQLSLVSRTIWGLPLLLLAPVALILFLSKRQLAIVFMLLLMLTTTPFLFLKVPAVIDSYYLFYFPSKFMLPLFIFSGAAASMVAHSRKMNMRILSLMLVCSLLVLQVLHARAAYASISRSAESYRGLASGALDRNIRGKDLLIVSQDAIFYNFFYASYTDSAKSAKGHLGTVRTVDNPDLFGLLSGRLNRKLDCVYRDGKWSDGNGGIINAPLRIDSTVPKPTVSMDLKGRFLSFTVTDRRNGSFYGALKTAFSPENIAIQSMLLPKYVPLRLGLVRDRDMLYLFYCDGGSCSEPLVISTGGG